ncbi:hypothetical protein FRB97_000564 [Tulasnella sp. 331]|nr:hypothetical protein FRB97_000564 [Tulasnella sp. 331]
MPSINVVKNWYAQSFEELITCPPPPLPTNLLTAASSGSGVPPLPEATPNPINRKLYGPASTYGMATTGVDGPTPSVPSGSRMRIPMEKRFYSLPNIPTSSFPPELHAYNKKFTKMLENIKHRHDPTVTTVAQGVLEWKQNRGKTATQETPREIQDWLDRFYMSRIGIRFLIGQHVALNTLEPHEDWVGIICTKSNVHDIVTEAIENARFVCEDHYALFRGPPVQLICPKELSFPYVPGHLSHIVFELLKNSLRAVVERYGTSNEATLPPIKVVVIEGKEDITVKISDEGGGIPRSAIPLIWTYMYTTMELGSKGVAENLRDSDFKAPMAGFGYGLPLSRLVSASYPSPDQVIELTVLHSTPDISEETFV